jgi:hypothetical protein
MHSERYIAFLCALCLAVLLTGCSTTRITDSLPSGVPKGYVLFYPGRMYSVLVNPETTSQSKIAIYQLQNGEEVYVGDCSRRSFSDGRLKVACRPGQHTFVAKFDATTGRVQVEVRQDRTASVRVVLTRHQRMSGHNTWTYYYEIPMKVEETFSIE